MRSLTFVAFFLNCIRFGRYKFWKALRFICTLRLSRPFRLLCSLRPHFGLSFTSTILHIMRALGFVGLVSTLLCSFALYSFPVQELVPSKEAAATTLVSNDVPQVEKWSSFLSTIGAKENWDDLRHFLSEHDRVELLDKSEQEWFVRNLDFVTFNIAIHGHDSRQVDHYLKKSESVMELLMGNSLRGRKIATDNIVIGTVERIENSLIPREGLANDGFRSTVVVRVDSVLSGSLKEGQYAYIRQSSGLTDIGLPVTSTTDIEVNDTVGGEKRVFFLSNMLYKFMVNFPEARAEDVDPTFASKMLTDNISYNDIFIRAFSETRVDALQNNQSLLSSSFSDSTN